MDALPVLSKDQLLSTIKKDVPRLVALDMDQHLDSYPYDPNRLLTVRQTLRREITTFNNTYGPYMVEHLDWVAATFGDCLRKMGFNENLVGNAMQAVLNHDCGKTRQPGLWTLSEGKPSFSKDTRAERNEHVWWGPYVYGAALFKEHLFLSEDDEKAADAERYFMVAHHDRLNGSGPNGIAGQHLGRVMRAMMIVDMIHGKLKVKSAQEALAEMRGSKHAGELDQGILELCAPVLLAHAPRARTVAAHTAVPAP